MCRSLSIRFTRSCFQEKQSGLIGNLKHCKKIFLDALKVYRSANEAFTFCFNKNTKPSECCRT